MSGSPFHMGTFEATLENMAKKAAQKGATGVIIISQTKNGMADQATGQAIRCKEIPAATPSAATEDDAVSEAPVEDEAPVEE